MTTDIFPFAFVLYSLPSTDTVSSNKSALVPSSMTFGVSSSLEHLAEFLEVVS